MGHNVDTKKITPDCWTHAPVRLAVILAGHLTEFTPPNATSTEMK